VQGGTGKGTDAGSSIDKVGQGRATDKSFLLLWVACIVSLQTSFRARRTGE